MSRIRVYIPPFDYHQKRFFEIFAFTLSGQVEIAKVAQSEFELTEQIVNSDWILIPVFTTGLLHFEGRSLIKNTAKLAKQFRKPFAVFSNSDFIVDVEVENALIFTPGAYKSKSYQISIPATLPEDPFEKWIGKAWQPIDIPSIPSIGFCGQATTHPFKAIKDFITFGSSQLKHKLGKTLSNPGRVFLPAYQRAKLLRYFEKDPRFQSDFILRNQYKGGAISPAQKIQVENDFYQNIHQNLFTICLRGMGNYSVRFYQTLAMGRIPVLVDTDEQIAFNDFIGLDKIIPVIPFQHRDSSPDLLFNYFNSKSKDELISIQQFCRNTWLEYYQKEGLIKYIAKSLRQKALTFNNTDAQNDDN